jgi:hypothetical protein
MEGEPEMGFVEADRSAQIRNRQVDGADRRAGVDHDRAITPG